MTTTNQALQSGRQALAQAAQELGIVLSEQALYWLLGQAYRESGLGVLGGIYGQFEGTNNWGAVYWPSETKPPNPFSTSWKGGGDVNPTSGAYKTRIAVYPSMLDGAKGFLHVVRAYGQEALNALASGTVTDFSRALYKRGYYTGYHCGEDGGVSIRLNRPSACPSSSSSSRIIRVATQEEADALNVRDYANLIQAGANEARRANQAPLEAPIQPGPLVQTKTPFPWALATCMVALGLAGTYALTRKGRRLPGLSTLRFT